MSTTAKAPISPSPKPLPSLPVRPKVPPGVTTEQEPGAAPARAAAPPLPNLLALHAAYGNGAVARALAPRPGAPPAATTAPPAPAAMPPALRPEPAPAPVPPPRPARPKIEKAVEIKPVTTGTEKAGPKPGAPPERETKEGPAPAAPPPGGAETEKAKEGERPGAKGPPAGGKELAEGPTEARGKAVKEEAKKAPGIPPAEEKAPGPKGEAEEAAAEKAPASPQDDPGFQAVVGRVNRAASKARAHPPAHAKATEAQAAAVSPPSEAKSQAAAGQVEVMDQAKPKPFDRDRFVKAVLVQVNALTPRTMKDADEFKRSGRADALKGGLTGEVAASKTEAQGDIPAAVQGKPGPSGVASKPPSLPPPEAAPSAPDVAAAQAVPKPRPDSEVSLQANSAALNQTMASEGVTDEQLARSNEPQFEGALKAKQAAQEHAATAPGTFRQQEHGMLTKAQAEAQSTAQAQLGGMVSTRGQSTGGVAAQQQKAKTRNEEKRAEVAQKIQDIYDETKKDVKDRLAKLDQDVNKAFDEGATAAQQTFVDDVERRKEEYKVTHWGILQSIADWLSPPTEEYNRIYNLSRGLYISKMTAVIEGIAGIVEAGLKDVKERIAAGKQEIQDYIHVTLPLSLQEVGREAAENIQGKFDELVQSVDQRQDQLISSLGKKFSQSLQQVDAKVTAMKEADKGLFDRAKEAVAGTISTIKNLKNMLMNALARAADAIVLIINDPIGFFRNLASAVKQGFQNFVAKIGFYLEQGLMGWLFGALEGAGIELPKSFDLKGILHLVLQVLGLTYTNIRARAVNLLGEKVVAAIETTVEIFKKLITEGPGALWEWIKEKVGDLKEAVLGAIKDWLITKIITAGIVWVISLLNPVSAFIKACKAIYDLVMFFVERAKQILALVNAVIDSVVAIAKGSLGAAAAFVENALAKSVPLVISLLASLLGLGGISDTIRKFIEKVRAPINAAIDWVIKKAVGLVKDVGKFFGFGKEREEKKPDERNEGEKRKALHEAVVEGTKLLQDKSLSVSKVRKRLPAIKQTHRVTVLDVAVESKAVGKEVARIHGKINPEDDGAPVEKTEKTYLGCRKVGDTFTGSFDHPDWQKGGWNGYPSHKVATHPANNDLGYRNGTLVPKPEGEFTVSGKTRGAPPPTTWRASVSAEKDAVKENLLKQPGVKKGDAENQAKDAVVKKYQAEGWAGVKVWQDLYLLDGYWEGHHIKPVNWSGEDVPNNLQFLRNADHYPFRPWFEAKKKEILKELNKPEEGG